MSLKKMKKYQLKKSFKNILSIAKSALIKWWDKDPFKESAAIAYYAIFSLPGLMVVIITLVGYFFEEKCRTDS